MRKARVFAITEVFMETNYLLKRYTVISRFLEGLETLALKNTSADRLEKEVNDYVLKRLPSAQCFSSFLSDCYSYALAFRDYTFYENCVRLFESF